jgi:hypothetical protein
MAKRKSTKGQTTSTKHTHKIKDRITQTPLKTGGKLRCSTSGIRRANLVTTLCKIRGTKDHFSWVKVPGTAPY